MASYGSGSLKRALDDLEKCGCIRKYRNRYEKRQPAVYQLIDPFLLFGFKFMDDDPVIERKDQVTNICEMKFTDDEFSIDAEYAKQLSRKMQVFRSESKTKNATQLTMVCARGLRPNAHSWNVASVVTADGLFA